MIVLRLLTNEKYQKLANLGVFEPEFLKQNIKGSNENIQKVFDERDCKWIRFETKFKWQEKKRKSPKKSKTM